MFVFTSCTNNYIPKARILASSLKSFHPDWTFCLLLGEAPPEGFDLRNEPFDRVVHFDQLGIPDYHAWLFKHRVVEICTAAKGPALYHFLVREGHAKVMYIDPDIMVCDSLSGLENLLDIHDVLLTPHQLIPQETQQSIVDNERCALQYGVFNLGFAAAAGRGDGPAFARWWRDRLLQYCYDDIPNGLFTDQRWCDLAPAFFPGLHIVRDPGCNAASWNLTDRVITRREDGAFMANEGPLRFYHFTGFDSGAGDSMTARYAKDMPAVHELWGIYRERLMASGHALLGKQRWKYMSFDDGTPITDAMRLLYRERPDVRKAFPNPFVRPGFYEWYMDDQGQDRSSMLGRIGRKVKCIAANARLHLDRHGGFPRGLPGLARQSLAWFRKWGLRGMLRRIWSSTPQSGAPDEDAPLLRDILAQPDSENMALLEKLFAPAHRPVCIIEHDWGGGAEAYCQKRIDSLLAEGRAVIRLRGPRNSDLLDMTVCHGADSFRCRVEHVADLGRERFPRIADVIVNEFAGWYHWHYELTGPIPLPGTIPGVMRAVRELAGVARSHEARVELLFHDFFPVCPTINLLTPELVYCRLAKSIEECDSCALRGAPFSMAEWRSAWGELLELADTVVFFSEDTKNVVSGAYPLREAQVRVCPHEVEPLGEKLDIPVGGPMRIAVVGNIHLHKGAAIVTELAALLQRRLPEAEILVFGGLEARDIPPNVRVLGQYRKEELAGLLQKHGITVGLFPSIWPETFSYVIHELASLGLPLVSFDLGAQGDFVKKQANGRVAREVNAEAALQTLVQLDALRTAG